MIYYTGDIHGSGRNARHVCARMGATAGDTVVFLGDVGANY